MAGLVLDRDRACLTAARRSLLSLETGFDVVRVEVGLGAAGELGLLRSCHVFALPASGWVYASGAHPPLASRVGRLARGVAGHALSPLGQRPVKVGLRFSWNAVMPSA